MSIRPVSTTMGISTPASRAEGTGYYTYRGKQPHRPPREIRAAPPECQGIEREAEASCPVLRAEAGRQEQD